MKYILSALLIGWLSLTSVPALAINATEHLGQVGAATYGNSDGPGSIETMIGLVLEVVLGLLGVIMLVLVIYAGFLWMTAGGKADQVEKAKNIMRNGAVGLVLILSAYAVTVFVINSLTPNEFDIDFNDFDTDDGSIDPSTVA